MGMTSAGVKLKCFYILFSLSQVVLEYLEIHLCFTLQLIENMRINYCCVKSHFC